jgi:hypothetical protein
MFWMIRFVCLRALELNLRFRIFNINLIDESRFNKGLFVVFAGLNFGIFLCVLLRVHDYW